MSKRTPPSIANGSYVAWDGGKGRVDLIVANGKVPGIKDDVEGTDKTPAARVVVLDDSGKATGEKLGMSVAKLRRIPPLRGGKAAAGDPGALVAALAAHEEKCEDMSLPTHARVSGRAVKAVYDRGVKSWPGEHATTLTAEEWALGRVDHFIKAAAGQVAPVDAGNDTDLLDPSHPLASAAPAATDVPAVDASTASLDDDEIDLWDDEAVPADEPSAAPADPGSEQETPAEDAAEPANAEDTEQGDSETETPAEDAESDDATTREGKGFAIDRAALDAQLADLIGE